MATTFGFSLDNTVMINVLPEISETMHEKMSKAINLYWFHNDALEQNNSLYDRFN